MSLVDELKSVERSLETATDGRKMMLEKRFDELLSELYRSQE